MRWTRAALILAAIAVLATAAVYARARYRRARFGRLAGQLDAAACPEAIPLGGACSACVATECCAQIHACYADSRCIDLNDCWVRCGEPDEGPKVPRAECPQACEARYPAVVTLFHAWDGCVRDRCGDICPRGPSEDEEGEERERRR